jgi:predicted DNA-binding transcriptional regulator AlpA
MARVTAQTRQTLRRADIALLLNVTGERARQITHKDDFPPPVLTGPPRAWDRTEIEVWMDEVQWWESKPWRKPATEA